MPVLKKQNADGTWDMVTSDSQAYATKTEFNSHIADCMYQRAGGTATEITVNISEALVTGLPLTFIAAYTDTVNSKTINGKKFYKPTTTTSPSTIAGKAYTIWYDSTGDSGKGCFFIKASAEGNTVAAHVLAGDSFSNDSDTGILGTMVNNGAVTITPSSSNQTINSGYHNGSGYVKGDSNLAAANIKYGVTIFGVTGIAVTRGSIAYTTPGTYTWTVPEGVTSVSVAIQSATGGGGGGGGASFQTYYSCSDTQYYGTDGSTGNAGGVTSFGSAFSVTAVSAGGGGPHGGNGVNGTDYGGGDGGIGGIGMKIVTGHMYHTSINQVWNGGNGGGHANPTTTTRLISVTPGDKITITVGAGGTGGSNGSGAKIIGESVDWEANDGLPGNTGLSGAVNITW